MLATILKSPKAVETTLAIIDTFTKVRELRHMITEAQSFEMNLAIFKLKKTVKKSK